MILNFVPKEIYASVFCSDSAHDMDLSKGNISTEEWTSYISIEACIIESHKRTMLC